MVGLVGTLGESLILGIPLGEEGDGESYQGGDGAAAVVGIAVAVVAVAVAGAVVATHFGLCVLEAVMV